MAKTKGVGFVNVRSFTIGRFGKEGWQNALARLSPETRSVAEKATAEEWYSVAAYAELIRAIDNTLGARDLRLLRELGRYEAEQDLTVITRTLLGLFNPGFVVEKSMAYWNRFHDSGKWEISRRGKHLEGILRDWGIADQAMCEELIGYMSRLLELVGAKNLTVVHARCRARGDSECAFIGGWD